jgi:hypothetical protein
MIKTHKETNRQSITVSLVESKNGDFVVRIGCAIAACDEYKHACSLYHRVVDKLSRVRGQIQTTERGRHV